ncbi:MAG: MBL fold metallo-hydrolase [Actinobacteria bacterium]|nr:MBL fold metallo-hydrolase [Actinomycetota bacterium]
MIIKWLGHAMFEILDEKSGLKIITDPYSEEVGYPVKKRSADVVTQSHDHFDHNNISSVESKMVIKDEGLFEYGGVRFEGLRTFHDEHAGKQRGINLIFKIQGEMTVVHMGDYGEKFLRQEVKEFISGADILLLPVGGVFTIGPREAVQVVKEANPKIVIPMHYKTPHLKFELSSVDDFLNESGLLYESREELRVFKENLDLNSIRVYVLNYEV